MNFYFSLKNFYILLTFIKMMNFIVSCELQNFKFYKNYCIMNCGKKTTAAKVLEYHFVCHC